MSRFRPRFLMTDIACTAPVDRLCFLFNNQLHVFKKCRLSTMIQQLNTTLSTPKKVHQHSQSCHVGRTVDIILPPALPSSLPSFLSLATKRGNESLHVVNSSTCVVGFVQRSRAAWSHRCSVDVSGRRATLRRLTHIFNPPPLTLKWYLNRQNVCMTPTRRTTTWKKTKRTNSSGS